MAGPKKKKIKPAANPARGFATTSVASKPRVENPEPSSTNATTEGAKPSPNATPSSSSRDPNTPSSTTALPQGTSGKEELSPEEFERQLEESELQMLVEKYAPKVKRDAQRQKSRLETDRRLLRGQAEALNTRKWLPQELMDHILDLIQAESRFSTSSLISDTSAGGKMPTEEDLTMRLWTLQQTLAAAAFAPDKIKAVIRYVLEIAPSINSTKDNIWGLEEALDWLARECTRDELHDYDYKVRVTKAQIETPLDSPLPSGANSPRLLEVNGGQKSGGAKTGATNARISRTGSPRKIAVVCDEDIEPDNLIPAYLETKAKLFQIQRPKQEGKGPKSGRKPSSNGSKESYQDSSQEQLEEAKLVAKIERIEQDVLFDKFSAEQKWRANRIELEKEFAAKKKQAEQDKVQDGPAQEGTADDDIAKEAERIAAEILQQDDDDDDQSLSDLFASLPVQETDSTGKTTTVINGADGVKITIRDFGKWSGVSPTRILEETCRSRDSSVKVIYNVISETTYSNRHMVSIYWSKAQDTIQPPETLSIESSIYPYQYVFKMTTIATPDPKQSEAFIATLALFAIFSSTKEEKVFLRLPAVWRELWSELADAKKSQTDAVDRSAVKELRALIRQKQDQELEDGVLLQGAFKGRTSQRSQNDTGDDSAGERGNYHPFGPDYYQKIWADKSSTPRFNVMLRSRMQLPMWNFRDQVLDTIEREQVVIVCGETG
ncbi:hypothetical protein F5X99DRAFT_242175 [Biscogniauxia marginata]|nr:hypothetical protein F5X99DRAFT_242175 [Biscogniauxia marginata]